MDNKKLKETIALFLEHNKERIQYSFPEANVDFLFSSQDLDEFVVGSDFENRTEIWLNSINDDRLKNELLLLLSNYNFYSYRLIKYSFNKILDQILNTENIDCSQILIITEASPKHCISGGDSVRSAILEGSGGKLSKERIITYGIEKYENNENIKCVVFSDDIIGSGRTMYGLITRFCDLNPWLTTKSIYIVCVCGRQKKIDKKIKELLEIGIIAKCILIDNLLECFDEAHISNNKKIIELYEKSINDKNNVLDNDEEKECVLGYEHNQLLVSFSHGTPNNTLSSFWRKTKISPDPLFLRNPKQTILKAIQYNKEEMKKYAYYLNIPYEDNETGNY